MTSTVCDRFNLSTAQLVIRREHNWLHWAELVIKTVLLFNSQVHVLFQRTQLILQLQMEATQPADMLMLTTDTSPIPVIQK